MTILLHNYYLKYIGFQEYFIWIRCVNIVQLTLQSQSCMKFLRKMLANQIKGKQGQ